MKRLLLAAALVLPLVSIRSSAQPSQAKALVPSGSRFHALEDDYWDTQMRLSPLYATYVGYPKYNDRLDDPGEAGRVESHREYERLKNALLGTSPQGLSPEDTVSYGVMLSELNRALDGERYKFWEWKVDQMEGPQSWIATSVATGQPMKTAEDAQALVVRMKSIPAYFASYIANLREGLRDGNVAARVPVEKTISQLDELLKTKPEDTVWAKVVLKLPANIQPAVLPQVMAAVDTHVTPSLQELRDFLKNEYLPKARGEKIGLAALPGGLDAYKYLISYHTTLNLSPEEIHQIGLDEVKSIRAEMEAVAKHSRYKGDLASFLAAVRADPKNYYASREEIVKDAQAKIDASAAKLPKWFGLLPKTALVVKPFEEYRERNEVDAEYFEPSDDLARPGIFYVNTYKPETRARFQMGALAFHEGIPGHHLQLAIAREIPGLPTFRRHGDYNAFVEGWALYTERLADEMGLYKTDLDRLGMLSMQAWRACRLVVDTGLHAFGWTRQQAIDYMKENTAMGTEEIEAEVDRYTIWPGQALAYKIGQREIMKLRDEAKKAQGRKFDIKKFHDDVLKNGAVPLSLLRDQLAPELTGKP
jgi:uncharacterized protein (DUF885 family)